MINDQVLKNIYNDLLELSSKELQIEYWIKGTERRESSYIELINRLFDDDDLDLFVDKEALELGWSENIVKELRHLRDKLNSYDEGNKSHEEIITDSLWQEITHQAQRVIKLWEKEYGDKVSD